jgi:uncharacterized membrane protein YfcA
VALGEFPNLFLLAGLVLVVATLYASVGHGGASGYLAVMSFFSFSPAAMASTALILNILVAGLAWRTYARAGHFQWGLTWPFLLASVPAAFLGGLLPVTEGLYRLVLAAILAFITLRLWLPNKTLNAGEDHPLLPSSSNMIRTAIPMGAGIGLVSGMIGVGGGIFLSPLLLLLRWGSFKTIAATSALFIVANAAFGLLGRVARHDVVLIPHLWILLGCGVLGCLLGARMGAYHLPLPALRRLLGLVLVIAATKLILTFQGP